MWLNPPFPPDNTWHQQRATVCLPCITWTRLCEHPHVRSYLPGLEFGGFGGGGFHWGGHNGRLDRLLLRLLWTRHAKRSERIDPIPVTARKGILSRGLQIVSGRAGHGFNIIFIIMDIWCPTSGFARMQIQRFFTSGWGNRFSSSPQHQLVDAGS